MKPEIVSVLPSGHGHWEVKVEQYYKNVKNVWRVVTNDSILIDEYKHDGLKRAKSQLIRIAKRDGSKKTIEISKRR